MKIKKKFLTAVVVCVGMAMFFACGHKYQGKLVPVLDNSTGKWGYADTLGKNMIAPKWDMATDFSEGLAAVGLNNRFGYIDETGVEVIPITFESTGSFLNSMALVSLNDKWGFIDKTGVEIIPIIYNKAEPFSEGLSEVELDGKIGSIDTTGAIIIPFQNIGMETDDPVEVLNEFLKRFDKGEDFMSLCSVDLNETKVSDGLNKYKTPGGISVLFFEDNDKKSIRIPKQATDTLGMNSEEGATEVVHVENVTKLICLVIARNSGIPIGVISVNLLYNSKRNTYLIMNI